jgi:hypothetical protein
MEACWVWISNNPKTQKVVNHVVHGLDLQVHVGLVTAKCAKPNKYNVWLLPKAPTTFPTMVEDHVMSPK